MAMVVKNNMPALNTLNTLNSNTNALTNSLKKVSSGMRINGAADDASGYAISERMRVQIRSLDQAKANTQNGSSMMKTAEGAVSSTVEILKTLKEKCINAANDSNTDEDRMTIQKELNQFIDQIDDNANVTFNGKYLVDGSKNSLGKATATSLTNQSLAVDTKATDALTSLRSRSGDDLNIALTDTVTVSYVQAGKTFTTSFKVADEGGESRTLQDIFTKAEEIDSETKIFAESDNKAVVATTLGKTPTDAEVQAAVGAKKAVEADAQAAITTAQANVDAAQADVDTAQAAVDTAQAAVDTAQAAVDTAEAAEETAKKALDKSIAALKDAVDAYNTAQTTDADDITTAWDDNKSDIENFIAISGDAKFSTAAAMTGIGGIIAVATAVTDISTKLKTYNGNEYTTYTAAFDGADYTDRSGGAAEDTDDAKDALETAEGAMAAPLTDLSDAKAILAKKNTELTLAKSMVPGPAVISSKNVGLAASDAVVTTASGQSGITVIANTAGVSGQISGLTISVSDADGNIKKSVNASLDAFAETVRAQNESEDNAISLQVGAKANQSIKVGLTDMRSEALGLKGADGTKLNIATQANANAAISVLESALQKALDQQTTIGAVESRLEYTAANLTVAAENVTASESTIRDADMAKEMTEYTKNNVLMQAAQSMLAQANQNSSNVLSLLQ